MNNKVLNKILAIIGIFVLSLTFIFGISGIKTVNAQNNFTEINEVVNSNGEEIYNLFKDFVNGYPDRTSGSKEEKAAGDYIASKFEEHGIDPYFKRTNDTYSYVKSFTSQLNGTIASQNVAGIIKSDNNPQKKQVIIGAHYDNVYGFSTSTLSGAKFKTESNGAYDNGGGVAVMLALSKILSAYDFGFDIIFVAFGSEENYIDGSYAFVSDMTQAERENTLLMINIDSIICGDYLYLYTDDVDRIHDDYIRDVASQLSLVLRKAPVDKKISVGTSGLTNRVYSHIGNMSDNARFSNVGINVAFFLAYNWDDGEYAYESGVKENIMHTSKDTIAHAERIYGIDFMTERMTTVSDTIINLLKKSDFVDTMSLSYSLHQNNDFFYNKLWAGLIGLGIALILSIIAIFIVNSLKKQRIKHQMEMAKTEEVASKIDPNVDNSVFGREFEYGSGNSEYKKMDDVSEDVFKLFKDNGNNKIDDKDIFEELNDDDKKDK